MPRSTPTIASKPALDMPEAKAKVMCCAKVYEGRDQYDIEGSSYKEDTSGIAFTRVGKFVSKVAGQQPYGPDIFKKLTDMNQFPYFLRIMVYKKYSGLVHETRWFLPVETGNIVAGKRDLKFAEIPADKIPSTKRQFKDILDGCNYKCKEHTDHWFRITYFDNRDAPRSELSAETPPIPKISKTTVQVVVPSRSLRSHMQAEENVSARDLPANNLPAENPPVENPPADDLNFPAEKHSRSQPLRATKSKKEDETLPVPQETAPPSATKSTSDTGDANDNNPKRFCYRNTIPSAADAALIPKLPRSTKHEGLAKGAPQIRWDEQQNAIRHHGKIYFRCATESNSNRKLVVLRPWTQFAINAKTGKVYLTCELCREKTMNKGWAYVPEEGEEKKVV